MSSHDDSFEDVEIEQPQDSLASSSASGIRPVTIHQILDATRPHSEAKFTIDGIVIDRVSTVAQVVDVQERSSLITYVLHDGTSRRLLAKQWLSDGGDTLPEGHWGYVHIVGQLDPKVQTGSKNALIVKTIRALKDHPADQLSFHILQAAFVTLCFERGPPPMSVRVRGAPRYASIEAQGPAPPRSAPTTPIRTAGASRAARGDTPHQRSPVATSPPIPQHAQRRPPPESSQVAGPARPAEPARHRAPAPSDVPSRVASPSPIRPSTPVAARTPAPTTRRDVPAQESSGGSRRKSGIKRDPYAHLTVLQRAILLQILNTQYAEAGADVFTISRGVAHHNPTVEQIGDALDFLMIEGFIETTIDTKHYAIRTSHYPTSP